MALSLVLLIGASLMMKSFLRLQSVNPGFDYRGTLAMQVPFVGTAYDETGARWAALERITAERSRLVAAARGASADN